MAESGAGVMWGREGGRDGGARLRNEEVGGGGELRDARLTGQMYNEHQTKLQTNQARATDKARQLYKSSQAGLQIREGTFTKRGQISSLVACRSFLFFFSRLLDARGDQRISGHIMVHRYIF